MRPNYIIAEMIIYFISDLSESNYKKKKKQKSSLSTLYKRLYIEPTAKKKLTKT
jgi:hypothetical protein